MPIFELAPAPPTKLGVYKQLSTTAGVHVSPLQLGGMSLGHPTGDSEIWNQTLGKIDREASFKMLDAYFDAGGNFIDTANNYQDETSEMVIGEWMEKRGVRDQVFLATKYTTNYKRVDSSIKQKIMYAGNNAKSMKISLHESLKKLRTDYIDLFYVHWWDWDTSIEEVMQALHAFVLAGKILYLGISDAPAWVVARANQYARDHALTPFSVYQGRWNVMIRDFEREIIPMARAEGMALAPWQAAGGGNFFTDAEEAAREASGERGRTWERDWKRTDQERKVSAALEKVANELGRKHITSVALAYLLHKAPRVFPIVGGRKVEQLMANIEALDISLTPEQIAYLEAATPEFEVGFPLNFTGDGTEQTFFMRATAHLEKPLLLQPQGPSSSF